MRVMLDTNLWSSIGDEMVVDGFNSLMKARSCEVVMPPSTLVEVARLPVAAARQRIIHALVTGGQRRLPTEAQMESEELVSEIRRVRPQWLRSMPDTAKVVSLNNFWTNRIWREAVSGLTAHTRLRDARRRHFRPGRRATETTAKRLSSGEYESSAVDSSDRALGA